MIKDRYTDMHTDKNHEKDFNRYKSRRFSPTSYGSAVCIMGRSKLRMSTAARYSGGRGSGGSPNSVSATV